MDLDGILHSSHGIRVISMSFSRCRSVFGRAIHGSRVIAPAYFIRARNRSSKLFGGCHLGQKFAGCLLSKGNIVVTGGVSTTSLSTCMGRIN